MQQLKKACIIGAGSSGLTAVKALKDAGIDFDCFEARDVVGGLWTFHPDPSGPSGAYRGLNSNAPKSLMQYDEYHLDDDLPAYPSHWDFSRYFRTYAEKFGLIERITFNTRVDKVTPLPSGRFKVETSDGQVREYSDIVVANGHHWNPRWPNFPGTFNGTQMHSRSYRDGSIAVDRKVVVVGLGNSAMDISAEVSDMARRVYLSARRGVHFGPKFLFGSAPSRKAFDSLSSKWGRMRSAFLVRLLYDSPESLGLPKPDHAFGDAHPSASSRLPDRIRHGRVIPKPNIAELKGDKVRFVDGTEVEADLIIYCTGYNISFPFFDEDYISAPENEINPYLQVALPDRPGIWFVGLCQPIGSIQPLAEVQSKWIADLIAGKASLPDTEEMKQDIATHRDAHRKRFVRSARNTIEVDHVKYRKQLERAHTLGLKRASRY
jgi:dimethylaniline monooxygenase (N-oxide forming)